MREISFDRKSIRTRLIMAFVVTSFLPIALVNIVAYYNTSRLVKQNVESMTNANLEQIRVSLDVWLDSYADILFQVYTDDDIVKLVDRINAGEDVASNRQMLRRALRGMVYTKDYVKFISVITDSGELVFYNQLTSATTRTSWMDSISMPQEELYRVISGDNMPHTIPTGEKVVFGSNSCYLFHMGRRIIDYRNVDKRCGIVLVSIDEKLLEDICSTTENGLNFIVDREGTLISCAGSDRVGEAVYESGADEEERKAAYRQIARETGLFGETDFSIYSVRDERTGWEIVRVTSQEELIQALRQQQQLRIFIIVLSLCTVMAFMFSQVTKMTGSINKVVETMRKAGKGDLGIHVDKDPARPTEIEVIAEEFNSMMDKLKQSTQKQKDAEIAALEAQINPHFLYNTLDIIVWMIENEQKQDAVKIVTALARFFRISLSKGKSIVTVRDELEHVRNYLMIQQTRFKNKFVYRFEAGEEVMDLVCLKLMLQPLVENAIYHGMEFMDGDGEVCVKAYREADDLWFQISDNGLGMTRQQVESLLDEKEHVSSRRGSGIGVKNVNERIRLYFGDDYGLQIWSEPDEGTVISIHLPAQAYAETAQEART